MERLASSSRVGEGRVGIGHGTSLVSGHFARLDTASPSQLGGLILGAAKKTYLVVYIRFVGRLCVVRLDTNP